MITDASHLSLQLGRHKCKCGEPASILIRCRKCKAVIARCGGCGRDIERQAAQHC